MSLYDRGGILVLAFFNSRSTLFCGLHVAVFCQPAANLFPFEQRHAFIHSFIHLTLGDSRSLFLALFVSVFCLSRAERKKELCLVCLSVCSQTVVERHKPHSAELSQLLQQF